MIYNQRERICQLSGRAAENNRLLHTPPLWTDLLKILPIKPIHASSFALECTDFKNVIFEKIH